MFDNILPLLLAGAAGGLVRGVVGFIKHQFAYKKVEFRPWYLAFIMFISGLVGLLITWAVVESGLKLPILDRLNPAITFIVGYAGGDIIENIYKILVGKTTLYPLPEK